MKSLKKTSKAYFILRQIVNLGGSALITQLGNGCLSTINSAILLLKDRCYIEINETRVIATENGKAVVASVEHIESTVISPSLKLVPVRSISNAMTGRKPLSMAGMYASVRVEGLSFKNEPSLMGSIRKLPSGEVVD